MTTTPSTEQRAPGTQEAVIEIDRIRAANFVLENLWPAWPYTPEQMLSGRCDDVDPLIQLLALQRRTSSPPEPTGDVKEMMEQAARAIFPNEWAFIDRERAAAKCYRETPHEQAGFQSREAADERATEREAGAQRSVDWTIERTLAGLEAAGLSSPSAPRLLPALHEAEQELSMYAAAENRPGTLEVLERVREAIEGAGSSPDPQPAFPGEIGELIQRVRRIAHAVPFDALTASVTLLDCVKALSQSQPGRATLRRLVDVVWQSANEDQSVPDTEWADRMIDSVFKPPLPQLEVREGIARDLLRSLEALANTPGCGNDMAVWSEHAGLVQKAAAILASAPAAFAGAVDQEMPYPADDWRERGYPSPDAEIDDMANVGRALIEAIASHSHDGGALKGWMPADCPAEVVGDLVERLAQTETAQPRGDDAAEIIANAAVRLYGNDTEAAAYMQGRDDAIAALSRLSPPQPSEAVQNLADAFDDTMKRLGNVRNEALEEAARVAESMDDADLYYTGIAFAAAKAIRTLKSAPADASRIEAQRALDELDEIKGRMPTGEGAGR